MVLVCLWTEGVCFLSPVADTGMDMLGVCMCSELRQALSNTAAKAVPQLTLLPVCPLSECAVVTQLIMKLTL